MRVTYLKKTTKKEIRNIVGIKLNKTTVITIV